MQVVPDLRNRLTTPVSSGGLSFYVNYRFDFCRLYDSSMSLNGTTSV